MSNREICYNIINSFSEEQLGNIITMLNTIKILADESADDAYCSRLYADYQAETDKGEPMSINEFAQGLGVML